MSKSRVTKRKNNKSSTVTPPQSFFEKYNRFFEFNEAIMLAFIAYKYLQLWVNPAPADALTIFQYAGLMGFEFIMVHSGVFMVAMPARISLLVFVPLYGLFAWAFNEIIGGNLATNIYLIVVFNRMRFAFFNTSPRLMNIAFGKSALAAIVYFFLIFAVSLGQNLIPNFGLSEAGLERIGYENVKSHGGLLLDVPKTSMCLGFSYYSIMCLYSILLQTNYSKRFYDNLDKKN